MKSKVFVLITMIFGMVGSASALDLKSITAKPTANAPQFKDKKVWASLVGDEYFLKQKWEKGRTYIWNIQKSIEASKGSRRRYGPEGFHPDNWIDAATGKPATELPDMNTDLILPDSETPYKASLGGADKKGAFCRHVTVGKNASFSSWGARHHRFRLFGNLWIRPGGSMRTGQGTIVFSGDKHTFLRYDWPEDGVLRKLHKDRAVSPYKKDGEIIQTPWNANRIGTYMAHDKTKDSSTEVVGFASMGDEVGIKSGTFIVGRDSRFVTIGPSSVSINKDAKVVLMDGAQCSHGQNQFVNRDWGVQTGGQVSGGTPDRPLKRDAYMGVGYRNWMNLPIPQRPNDKKELPTTADGTKLYYAYLGANAMVKGDLIGYPAKGSDARLVVCWQRISSGGAGSWGRTDEDFQKVFPKIAPKIRIEIAASAKIENVRFDDLPRGGIVTSGDDIFKNWKNVTFGDACLSKDPKELIRKFNPKDKKQLAPEKKYISL
ncbi:MAG: hypothetical protein HN350_09755 [Phycisphaerales bacterium]|jgi:hypothetical protein|nr:hypothetical protein [Phycisphaerales bacterium]